MFALLAPPDIHTPLLEVSNRLISTPGSMTLEIPYSSVLLQFMLSCDLLTVPWSSGSPDNVQKFNLPFAITSISTMGQFGVQM